MHPVPGAAPSWLRLTDGGVLGAVLALICQSFHEQRTVDGVAFALSLAFMLVFVLTSSR